MKPVEIPASDLADLVELLYAESGATDVDAAKRERGAKVFESACTDCHSRDEGVAGASGPGLAGLGSRDYYTSFIGNPKSPVHMGADGSQMPRFDRELSMLDRDALAGVPRVAAHRDEARCRPPRSTLIPDRKTSLCCGAHVVLRVPGDPRRRPSPRDAVSQADE